MQLHPAGWGGMLALSSLAAESDEERGKVQSLTLTGCPPSYKQLIADHQQKVSSTLMLSTPMRVCIHADPNSLHLTYCHGSTKRHTHCPCQEMCSPSNGE